LLVVSCEDDPPHPADCPSGPDFEVLISALDAPLPADTVVTVNYGGGVVEEYRIPDHGKHHVLFCAPSDREGNPVNVGGHGGEGALEAPGGRGGAPSSGFEALSCELWTDGPATLSVETSRYPTRTEELRAKNGKCTVSSEIELSADDGGV
jgi:hypothetical protein